MDAKTELAKELANEEHNAHALIGEINARTLLNIEYLSKSYAEYFTDTTFAEERQAGTRLNISYDTVTQYNVSGTAQNINLNTLTLTLVNTTNETETIKLENISLINNREFSLRALIRLRDTLASGVFNPQTDAPQSPQPAQPTTAPAEKSAEIDTDLAALEAAAGTFYGWQQAKLEAPNDDLSTKSKPGATGGAKISQTTIPTIELMSEPGKLYFEVSYPAGSNAQVGVMLTQKAIDSGIRILDISTDDEEEFLSSLCTGRSAQTTNLAGVDAETITLKLDIFVPDSVSPSDLLLIAYAGAIGPDGKWFNPVKLNVKIVTSRISIIYQRSETAAEAWSSLTPSYVNTATGKTIPGSPIGEDLADGFHSQALDSGNYDSPQVDPRTGLFHTGFHIANLVGNAGQGPTFKLNLGYSALEDNRTGLGDGWAFTTTHYNRKTKTLKLANGGRSIHLDFDALKAGAELSKELKATFRASGLVIEFIAESDFDYAGMRITYKDGTIEELMNPRVSATVKEKLLNGALDYANATIISSLDPPVLIGPDGCDFIVLARKKTKFGHVLNLDWCTSNGFLFLEKVSDGNSTLMTAHSSDNSDTFVSAINAGKPASFSLKAQIKIEVYPGKPEAFRADLHVENYLLRSIEITGTPRRETYGYMYLDKTGWILNSVLTASDVHDVVRYEAAGQSFPNQVKLSALPNASHHYTVHGLMQVSLSRYYVFSENNWLGAGAAETVESVQKTEAEISALRIKLDKLLEDFNTNYKHDRAARTLGNLTLNHLKRYSLDSLISNRIQYSPKSMKGLPALKKSIRDSFSRLVTCQRSLANQNRAIAREDALLELNGEYYYESYMTENSAGYAVYSLFGFDKYHAQIAHIIRRGDNQVSTVYDYPQPSSTSATEIRKASLLPRKVITTYSSEAGSREESQIMVYDSDGNLTKHTTPNGITTSWTYYQGSQSDSAQLFNLPIELSCPADPNGFNTHVKSEHVSIVHEGEIVELRWSFYGYSDLPALSSAGRVVVPTTCLSVLNPLVSSKKLAAWKADSMTVEMTSYETLAPMIHRGRIVSIGQMLLNEKGQIVYESSSKNEYAYRIEGNSLIRTEKQKLGYASPIIREQTQTNSVFTGRLVAQTDMTGNVSRFGYDVLGRLLSSESDCQTESTKHRATTIYTTVAGNQCRETTDVDGSKSRTELDPAGRTVRTHQFSDIAGTPKWYVTADYCYDGWGRLTEAHEYDHIPGGRVINGVVTVDQCIDQWSRISYDDWGNPWHTEYSDGRNSLRLSDPISRTVQEWNRYGDVNGVVTITACNARGLIEAVTTVDSSGVELTKTFYTFNAEGLMASETSATGTKKTFAYDDLGRCSIQQEDALTVHIHHPIDSSSDFPIGLIATNGTDTLNLGSRNIDRAERVISHKESYLGVKFNYGDADLLPNCVLLDNPLLPERSISIKYEKSTTSDYVDKTLYSVNNLALACKSFSSSTPTRQHETMLETYDDKDLQLTGYTSKCRQIFNSEGRLVKEERTDDLALGATSKSITYSLAGRRLTSDSELGCHLDYQYDEHGRCNEILYTSGRTVREYNINALIDSETITLPSGNKIISRYNYDAGGHEIFREFKTIKSDGTKEEILSTVTLTQEHYPDGRLCTSSLLKDNVLQRQEKYVYTPSGQLKDYFCEGPEVIINSFGSPLKEQHFTYDWIGNILKRVDVFDTFETVKKYQYSNNQLVEAAFTDPEFARSATAPEVVEADDGGTLDVMGLFAVDKPGGGFSPPREWHYDAYNRLTGTRSTEDIDFFYDDFRLSGYRVKENSPTDTSYSDLSLTEVGLGHRLILGSKYAAPGAPATDIVYTCALTNAQGTVLAYCSEEGTVTFAPAYTPFGFCPRENAGPTNPFETRPALETYPLIGINGELRDPDTGVYILGHGYRHYDPELGMFTTPDSLSPFGEGGILPYAYCGNDPINRIDPTGHTMSTSEKFRRAGIDEDSWAPASMGSEGKIITAAIWGGVAILSAPFTAGGSLVLAGALTGLAAASTAFSIASLALEESDPQLSSAFGWAAFGTGVAGAFIAPLDSLRKGLSATGTARLISVGRQATSDAGSLVKNNVVRIRAQANRMQRLIDGGLLRMKPVVLDMPETLQTSYLIRGTTINRSVPVYPLSVMKTIFKPFTSADIVASVSGVLTIVSTVMGEKGLDPMTVGRPASISGAAASLTAINIDKRFATLQKFPRIYSPLRFR